MQETVMIATKTAVRKRTCFVKQGEDRSVQNSLSNRLLSVGNPLLGKYFSLFASQINSPSLIVSLSYCRCYLSFLVRFCIFFNSVMIPQSQTYPIFLACNIF